MIVMEERQWIGMDTLRSCLSLSRRCCPSGLALLHSPRTSTPQSTSSRRSIACSTQKRCPKHNLEQTTFGGSDLIFGALNSPNESKVKDYPYNVIRHASPRNLLQFYSTATTASVPNTGIVLACHRNVVNDAVSGRLRAVQVSSML